MVNTQMSAEEAKEYTAPSATDAPKYPYGLALDLDDDDALQKLGIASVPAVGATEVAERHKELQSLGLSVEFVSPNPEIVLTDDVVAEIRAARAAAKAKAQAAAARR